MLVILPSALVADLATDQPISAAAAPHTLTGPGEATKHTHSHSYQIKPMNVAYTLFTPRYYLPQSADGPQMTPR